MKRLSTALCILTMVLAACSEQTATRSAPVQDPEQVSKPAPAPAEPVDPLLPGGPSELAGTFVPATFDWLVVANLEALQETALERQFRPWLTFLNEQPTVRQAVEQAGAGPLLGHAAVLGGIVRPETAMANEFFGAVFGLKQPGALVELARGQFLPEAPPEFAAYKLGTKDGGPAWFAGPDVAPQVEAVLSGKGKSINDSEEWGALQSAINTKAPFWALLRVPSQLPIQAAFIYREVPGLPYFPGVKELLGLTHAAVSVDFGDRLEVRGAVKLQSPEDAQVVVEQARLAAEATLWEPTLLFDVFEFNRDGPMVTFAAATSKKAWRVVVFWCSVAAQVAAYEEMRW
jgi:hypothetical protein